MCISAELNTLKQNDLMHNVGFVLLCTHLNCCNYTVAIIYFQVTGQTVKPSGCREFMIVSFVCLWFIILATSRFRGLTCSGGFPLITMILQMDLAAPPPVKGGGNEIIGWLKTTDSHSSVKYNPHLGQISCPP